MVAGVVDAYGGEEQQMRALQRQDAPHLGVVNVHADADAAEIALEDRVAEVAGQHIILFAGGPGASCDICLPDRPGGPGGRRYCRRYCRPARAGYRRHRGCCRGRAGRIGPRWFYHMHGETLNYAPWLVA